MTSGKTEIRWESPREAPREEGEREAAREHPGSKGRAGPGHGAGALWEVDAASGAGR